MGVAGLEDDGVTINDCDEVVVIMRVLQLLLRTPVCVIFVYYFCMLFLHDSFSGSISTAEEDEKRRAGDADERQI